MSESGLSATNGDQPGEARSHLHASSVTHKYGGMIALNDVSFEVRQGEVHALVGENGAGKSTLVKILTGAIRPTFGTLSIDDEAFEFGSPADAQAAGVGVVHQDYNLFPHLSVATNIAGVVPGGGIRRGPLTDRKRLMEVARERMSILGMDLDPRRLVGGLDAAERKLVEIARAMVRKPRFLLLDEPTAALEPRETERLLNVIASLRERGAGIILVSHRLGEICQVADRASALRDGRAVGSLTQQELTPRALTHLMVGDDVQEHEGPGHPAGAPYLELTGLQLREHTEPIDIEVREREIVALVGLLGSGCGAVLETVVGARPQHDAHITLEGKPVSIHDPADAVALGIGYAPEDRKRFGLVMVRSIKENMGLASLRRWSKLSFTRTAQLETAAREGQTLFDIRLQTLDQPVSSLSGGNQQKVLLARSHLAQARLLVLNEPSQGVDVSARRAIHDYLIQFAAKGGSILLSSSDIDEVRAIAHRIYIMHSGEVTDVFENTGSARPTRKEVTEALVHDRRAQSVGGAA